MFFLICGNKYTKHKKVIHMNEIDILIRLMFTAIVYAFGGTITSVTR